MEPPDRSSGHPREVSTELAQSCPGGVADGSQSGRHLPHGARASGSSQKWMGQQDRDSPARTVGRFSVVSTQDEWTLASPHSLRYSAPPDVYLDEGPCSPDMKLAVRRVQTASSIEVGVGEPASSDSGDERPQGRPLVQKQASLPGSSTASDLVKKATAFLHRSSRAGSLGSETPSRAGVKVPAISVTSFHSQSSYISSDNDSEFEDADIKRELRSLREKYVGEAEVLGTRWAEGPVGGALVPGRKPLGGVQCTWSSEAGTKPAETQPVILRCAQACTSATHRALCPLPASLGVVSPHCARILSLQLRCLLHNLRGEIFF